MTDARRPLATRNKRWPHAVARTAIRAGLTPNQVSVLSVVFAGAAGAALVASATAGEASRAALLVVGATGIQLRLLCNLIDGLMAVEGGLASKTGDIFNDLPDRLADILIIAGAGYAADAYARMSGMGAVCVTYGVGGLSVVNSVAGAWAEKSPVVVISGAPGLGERDDRPLLHHCVREWTTQYEVFQKVCAACTEIREADTAFREIDRVLDICFRQKRPVYIELPRDMVDAIHRWQQVFMSVLGRRMVFAADEYYLMAHLPFPAADTYEGFDLYEDGVGMARTFEREWHGEPIADSGLRHGFFSWVDGAPAAGYRAPRNQIGRAHV